MRAVTRIVLVSRLKWLAFMAPLLAAACTASDPQVAAGGRCGVTPDALKEMPSFQMRAGLHPPSTPSFHKVYHSTTEKALFVVDPSGECLKRIPIWSDQVTKGLTAGSLEEGRRWAKMTVPLIRREEGRCEKSPEDYLSRIPDSLIKDYEEEEREWYSISNADIIRQERCEKLADISTNFIYLKIGDQFMQIAEIGGSVVFVALRP